MNYAKITKEDVCNGNGLRVVLWLSGCSHRCFKCQNPQTWDCNSGILFDENAKREIINELKKEYISGITLSGGDPLYKENLTDVLDFVNEIRVLFPGKSIWLYTGYTWEEISSGVDLEECLEHNTRADIIKQCDIVVDGRYVDSLRDITLHWRGSSNQRVINVKETLKKGEIVLWRD